MSRSCAVLLVVVWLGAPVASAETIQVPKDYGSLQLAIDAAHAGDKIVVTGGSYPGILVVSGLTDLTIQGKQSPVVSDFDVVNCQRVRIEGFVVEGSTGGAALYGWASQDVTFRKCTIRDTAGDGVQTDLSDGLVVEKCQFDRIGGDGIALSRASHATIRKNRMADIDGNGVAIHSGGDNLAEKNVLASCGGPGFLLDGTSARNVIRRNEVSDGPGGFASMAGDGNLFERNTAIGVEYAYVLARGTDNTFTRNVAMDAGIGFEILSSVEAGENRLEKNVVTRPGEAGIRVRMPVEERSETVRQSVPISAVQPVDQYVYSNTGGYLYTTFHDGSVALPQFGGDGVLDMVTLTVTTDIAMTSQVDNPWSATTNTWWYQWLDVDLGSIRIDADQSFNRYYGPPKTIHDEAWDYDVVASASQDTDLEGFAGSGYVLVNLFGQTELASWWNPVNHYNTTWDGTIEVALTYMYVPDPAGTLVLAGNKVNDAEGNGYVVATQGVTLDGNKAGGCGACGFHVEMSGNTLQGNKAKGSGTYDLMDIAGGNLYSGNKFESTSVQP